MTDRRELRLSYCVDRMYGQPSIILLVTDGTQEIEVANHPFGTYAPDPPSEEEIAKALESCLRNLFDPIYEVRRA